MYLDVSKKVLQGTYITDGEVRIQESFVSSLGSLSSVAYFFFLRKQILNNIFGKKSWSKRRHS